MLRHILILTGLLPFTCIFALENDIGTGRFEFVNFAISRSIHTFQDRTFISTLENPSILEVIKGKYQSAGDRFILSGNLCQSEDIEQAKTEQCSGEVRIFYCKVKREITVLSARRLICAEQPPYHIDETVAISSILFDLANPPKAGTRVSFLAIPLTIESRQAVIRTETLKYMNPDETAMRLCDHPILKCSALPRHRPGDKIQILAKTVNKHKYKGEYTEWYLIRDTSYQHYFLPRKALHY